MLKSRDESAHMEWEMSGNGAVWRSSSSGPGERLAELKRAGGANSEMVLLAVVQRESHGLFGCRRNCSASLYVCIHLFQKSNKCNKLFIPFRCIYLWYIFIYWKVYFLQLDKCNIKILQNVF